MVSTAVWEVTAKDRKMDQEHLTTQALETQDEDQVSQAEGSGLWRGALEGTH